jgi:hypothetical protein
LGPSRDDELLLAQQRASKVDTVSDLRVRFSLPPRAFGAYAPGQHAEQWRQYQKDVQLDASKVEFPVVTGSFADRDKPVPPEGRWQDGKDPVMNLLIGLFFLIVFVGLVMMLVQVFWS